MDQALNSQKTPHTSPLRASYGMSFVSILMKNDLVIKGFYCNDYDSWVHSLYVLHGPHCSLSKKRTFNLITHSLLWALLEWHLVLKYKPPCRKQQAGKSPINYTLLRDQCIFAWPVGLFSCFVDLCAWCLLWFQTWGLMVVKKWLLLGKWHFQIHFSMNQWKWLYLD